MPKGRANLAIAQVLAAARLLAQDDDYADQVRLLRAVTCDIQEVAAKRQYQKKPRTA